MSATMTLTIPQQAPTSLTSEPPAATATGGCQNCGYAQPQRPQADLEAELIQARQRIFDLETQVLQLNQKAAAAIDRWADYEDELSRLRSQQSPTFTDPSTVSSPLSPKNEYPQQQQQQQQPSPTRGGFNRLSALLAPRKSTPNLRSSNLSPIVPPQPPVPEVENLLEALNREQGLRKAAEARLSKTSEEVEELSAALFEQANEMVAEERRARARLEERVEVLEKREKDKKRRLDRLESAVETIRRARAVLDGNGLGIVVKEETSEAVASDDVGPGEPRS